MSAIRPKELAATVVRGNWTQLIQFCRDVALLLQKPRFRCTQTWTTETANVRTLTLQVVDRRNHVTPGRKAVLVYFAGTAGGTPQNSQTVTLNVGYQLSALVASSAYLYLTDENGQLEIDLQVAGAATRYIGSAVIGDVEEGEGVTWAA